jgi:hypothetical protein
MSGSSKLWLENLKISSIVNTIFEKSFQSYVYPMIKSILEALRCKVNKPRVARIVNSLLLLKETVGTML